MPHQRERLLLKILEKRLSLFPIVGILGARQTGKSTLLRDLLSEGRKTKYITLDREELRVSAQRQPTLFIKNLEEPGVSTVCIDEIQKAPVLFDTLKAEVDELKRPGRFAISGSTEFTKKSGVHESLTGRIALLRLFPLNLSEIYQFKPQFVLTTNHWSVSLPRTPRLKDMQISLERGGMPGIFAVREKANRNLLFEAWIETTCTRDLAQFKIPRFDPDFARRLFNEIALLETPSQQEIARALGKTPRQIDAYLDAFKALFVVYEIPPHPSGVGKSLFYIFDSGIAEHIGASVERRLQICFLNECFSQFSYGATHKATIFHYRTSRGSLIDFVVQSKDVQYAVQLVHDEAPNTFLLRAAEAFAKKHPSYKTYVVAPCLHSQKLGSQIKIVPWNILGA